MTDRTIVETTAEVTILKKATGFVQIVTMSILHGELNATPAGRPKKGTSRGTNRHSETTLGQTTVETAHDKKTTAETIGSARLATMSTSLSERNATSAESQSQVVAEDRGAQVVVSRVVDNVVVEIQTDEDAVVMVAVNVEISEEIEAIVMDEETMAERKAVVMADVMQAVDEMIGETQDVVAHVEIQMMAVQMNAIGRHVVNAQGMLTTEDLNPSVLVDTKVETETIELRTHDCRSPLS